MTRARPSGPLLATLGLIVLLVAAAVAAALLVTTGSNRGAKIPRLRATPSTLKAVFASAKGGDTIYLAAGNYGTFTGGMKSSVVTLRPEPGATPTMALSFSPAANITLDGLKITDAQIRDARTHDIRIRNSNFDRAQIVLRTGQLANANILLDHNVHSNYVKCSGCYEGRIELTGGTSTPDGITIRNSEFYGGDGDGIQNGGNGTRIIGNQFHDLYQQANSLAHTDSIQLYGSRGTVIRGNWFHNVGIGLMSPDGGDHEVIENNVFKVTGSPYAVTIASDNGSVFRHNTVWGGGNCDYKLRCGVLYLGNKPGHPVSQGTTVTDNILTRICTCIGSPTSGLREDHNLISTEAGAGAHDIHRSPRYTGGTSPTTRVGFALTATSPGRAAAADGSDIGATIR
jgi:hypothetical protein